MQEVKLLRAGEPDIPAIRALADLIWNQHYPDFISRAQIDYMLDRMYSVKSLEEQMREKGHVFYLVTQDSQTVGFISVERTGKNEWQIHKFYIDQRQSKKGIGTAALDILKKLTNGSRYRLTVNRLNHKSINFYFKNGFRIESVADFDIGDGFVMNDFVMVAERQD